MQFRDLEALVAPSPTRQGFARVLGSCSSPDIARRVSPATIGRPSRAQLPCSGGTFARCSAASTGLASSGTRSSTATRHVRAAGVTARSDRPGMVGQAGVELVSMATISSRERGVRRATSRAIRQGSPLVRARRCRSRRGQRRRACRRQARAASRRGTEPSSIDQRTGISRSISMGPCGRADVPTRRRREGSRRAARGGPLLSRECQGRRHGWPMDVSAW
jgi:hypothetical protein